MKKLIAIALLAISSVALAWNDSPATDMWGDVLEDRWGDPVYLDYSGDPVDENGFDIKGQDIYNPGGIGKYDYDKPVYDSNGFRGDRWGNN